MAVHRVRVVEPDGEGGPSLLERAYAEVLAPSFPDTELESADELLPRLRAGGGGSFVAVALDGAGDPVGAAVADHAADSGVLLLSYLAVRADRRGGGVGSALLARVPGWRERCGAGFAVAEVEDPRFHSAGPFGDPVARLAFYQRHGYTLTPVPFVQPRIRAGADRVGGMFLAVLGQEPAPPAPLRAFIASYLREAEGLDAAEDMTYAGMLARLDRTVPLVPVPPERYAQIAPLDAAGELVRRDYPATAAAARLLGGDAAEPTLDRAWHAVVTRMRDGEPLPDPGRAVMAALVDGLEDTQAWDMPADPASEELLAECFTPPPDRWAGWWRDEYESPAWRSGPALREPAGEAVRRLAPIPRLVLVLSDVVGLDLAGAVSITGFPVEQHRAILAAARNAVAVLLDAHFSEPAYARAGRDPAHAPAGTDPARALAGTGPPHTHAGADPAHTHAGRGRETAGEAR